MTSPSERSLHYLKDNGYMVQRVEHWNAFAHKRLDLYNCIDIVAVKIGENGVLGIQTTTAGNESAHADKIMQECRAKMLIWLGAGNRLVVHGWGERCGEGKRKVHYLNIIPILIHDGKLIRGAITDGI